MGYVLAGFFLSKEKPFGGLVFRAAPPTAGSGPTFGRTRGGVQLAANRLLHGPSTTPAYCRLPGHPIHCYQYYLLPNHHCDYHPNFLPNHPTNRDYRYLPTMSFHVAELLLVLAQNSS